MDEDNIITLNDENGNEVEFEFLDLIGKWVIVHRLLKVDGVENEFVLETVFALFKERNKDFFTFE